MSRYIKEYMTFAEHRRIAQSCQDKSKGHMLNANFRLHYNKDTDTVDLISRWSDEILTSKRPDETTVLMASTEHLYQSETGKIWKMYGVNIHSIQGNKGIKRHHDNFIQESWNHTIGEAGGTFVYIPKGIILNREGKVIEAANYYESVINKEWNKKYTQISKIQRAKFHALNIMSGDIQPKRSTVITKDIGFKIIDLVIKNPNPTGIELYELRELLGGDNKNMRTELQGIFNMWRWERAKDEGAITEYSHENLPR